MKLLNSLGLVFATAISLTGCELYFGEHDDGYNDDSWSYCAADGYYICGGNECRWAGSECPDGGNPDNTACTDDADCAAGCFCEDGFCEEAGFCGDDADCPDGFHCDDRSSCVPDECSDSSQCNPGQTCDNGNCNNTCVCENDTDARNQGYGWCDETRNTCMPGEDPAGSCNAPVTCDEAMPNCQPGTVPVIANGCYTGECRAIASCDVAPTCETLRHERDCLDRASDCGAVYTGRNCTKPDGTACRAGDTNCTCASFDFAKCEDQSDMGSRVMETDEGARFPMNAL